jgi:hypothetical protein
LLLLLLMRPLLWCDVSEGAAAEPARAAARRYAIAARTRPAAPAAADERARQAADRRPAAAPAAAARAGLATHRRVGACARRAVRPGLRVTDGGCVGELMAATRPSPGRPSLLLPPLLLLIRRR